MNFFQSRGLSQFVIFIAVIVLVACQDDTDFSKPYIQSIDPPPGAENVSVDTSIVVTLSEPFDPDSVSVHSFFVTSQTGLVEGTYSIDENVLTLAPEDQLQSLENYSIHVTGDIRDRHGNSLYEALNCNFTTGEFIPPEIVEVFPVNGSLNTSTFTTIESLFNEPMQLTSITSRSFMVFRESQQIEGDIRFANGSRRVIFTPHDQLEGYSQYHVEVTTDVKDKFGNNLDQEYFWVFATAGSTRLLGGPGDDWGNVVQLTDDGGYILAGVTDSFSPDAPEGWIIKTDYSGTVQWDTYLGGAYFDSLASVQEIFDKGFIATGSTFFEGNSKSSVWLINFNRFGQPNWQKTLGDKYRGNGECVRQTNDGGFVVAGNEQGSQSAHRRAVLYKTDQRGNILWERSWGSADADWQFQSVRQASDNGFIVVGFYTAERETRSVIIKLNCFGYTEWERELKEGRSDRSWRVETGEGGLLYIIGSYYTTHPDWTNHYMLFLTLDKYGSILKKHSVFYYEYGDGWGGPDPMKIAGVRTNDAGFLGTASNRSGDTYIAKIDADGNPDWDRTYQLHQRLSALPQCVQQTAEGDYVLIGTAKSMYYEQYPSKDEIYFIKLDSNGNIVDYW